MKAEFIRCACTRMNDPWRKFCGGCGRKLAPSCACGFVNAKSDHYCGGCGKTMAQAAVDDDEQTTMPLDVIEIVS